jgi:hypothetical protein
MHGSLLFLYATRPLVKLDNSLSYQEYSCLQWTSPTPESPTCAGMQRFGVVYKHASELAAVMSIFKTGLAEGALNGVMLVDIQDNLLLIITGNEVASGNISALECLWESALKGCDLESWTVSIVNENELSVADSEVGRWVVAKSILSSASLGTNKSFPGILNNNTKEQITFSNLIGIGRCSQSNEPPSILDALHGECFPCSDVYLTNMNFGATEIMAPPSIFSHQELNEIGQAIRDTHTLRDQCLFALSLAQYRPIELQMMRASDVIDTDSLVRIRTQVSRASGRQKEVVLPPDVGQLLVGYIDSKGLSGNDFLFPSRNDNKSPMNPGALLNSFRSWLRDANIDPARRSLSCIRHSVLSANAKPESSSVDVGALRHNSKFMTDYYISVKRNKSDFE